MGLIPAIISGAAAIVGAAAVKVIADDAKEWTPWVTRHLLDIAVRRLPGDQQERYAEEWAAHLAEVPGVIGKLFISLQFHIAAFGARELDAKARLDAWRNERAAALIGIHAKASEVIALMEARGLTNEAYADMLKDQFGTVQGALADLAQRCVEFNAIQPALGITVSAAIHTTNHIFSTARAKIMTTTKNARN